MSRVRTQRNRRECRKNTSLAVVALYQNTWAVEVSSGKLALHAVQQAALMRVHVTWRAITLWTGRSQVTDVVLIKTRCQSPQHPPFTGKIQNCVCHLLDMQPHTFLLNCTSPEDDCSWATAQTLREFKRHEWSERMGRTISLITA